MCVCGSKQSSTADEHIHTYSYCQVVRTVVRSTVGATAGRRRSVVCCGTQLVLSQSSLPTCSAPISGSRPGHGTARTSQLSELVRRLSLITVVVTLCRARVSPLLTCQSWSTATSNSRTLKPTTYQAYFKIHILERAYYSVKEFLLSQLFYVGTVYFKIHFDLIFCINLVLILLPNSHCEIK